jgi:CBS domain-containing protein
MKYSIVCVECDTPIQKAIQLIEQSPFDRAFVLNENGSYQGCVSITDLRRLLISGARGTEPVDAYPLKHVNKLTDESLRDPKLADRMISDMELQGVRYLPIVDQGGNIIEVLSLEDLGELHGIGRTDSQSMEPARRVLVVGGAGYLGSVLTHKLLRRGFRVRILDSFIYGHRSLEPLANEKNLEIIEGDLRNIHTCVSSLADADAVVLLAAIVGDPASKVRPAETIETNVLAAQALASASKLHHINRFIYASTCSVYGIGCPA